MAWFCVNDTINSHDKFVRLEDEFDWEIAVLAIAIWTKSGADCAHRKTGRIMRARVRRLTSAPREQVEQACAALVTCGLWECAQDDTGECYDFVGWDKYNGDDAQRRALASRRKEHWKDRNSLIQSSGTLDRSVVERLSVPARNASARQYSTEQNKTEQDIKSFAKAKLSSANPETSDARREFSDSNLKKPETAQATPQSTQEGDLLPTPIRDENVEPSATSREQSTKQKRDAGSDERVREVFDFWRQHLDHPNAVLGSSRKSKIAARLREGYTVEELSDAIRGCKRSRYHQGENDAGKIYDDIELICRSASKVDYFVGLLDARPARASAPAPRIVGPVEVERPAYVPIGKDEQPIGFDSYGVPIFASQQRARTA